MENPYTALWMVSDTKSEKTINLKKVKRLKTVRFEMRRDLIHHESLNS
jgi:hypothetical protein